MYHGTECISNLGTKIWGLVSRILKEICDSDKSEKAIKQWKPEDCAKVVCKALRKMSVFWKKKIT